MGRLIKAEWNCPYCGTKNSGPIRDCPNCGHPIGGNVHYDLPKDIEANYVSDDEAIHVNRNPNWRCDYCGCYNSDSDLVCVSCGAERTSESRDYFEVQEESIKNNISNSSSTYNCGLTSSLASEDDGYSNHHSSNSNNNHQSLFSRINFRSLMIVLLSIIGISILVYALIPKEKTMQVTALSWERSIDVERYQTVDESGWSLPVGARLRYTREEISGYEQVVDHYETKTRTVSEQVLDGYEEVVTGYRDLGNGYFEEITSSRPVYRTESHEETYQEPVYKSVPIYDTKYYYEIDKWLFERKIETSGTSNTPYWGEVVLNDDERTGSKSESYYVTGLVNDKEKTYSFSFDDWSLIHIGEEIRFKASFGYGTLINEDSF